MQVISGKFHSGWDCILEEELALALRLQLLNRDQFKRFQRSLGYATLHLVHPPWFLRFTTSCPRNKHQFGLTYRWSQGTVSTTSKPPKEPPKRICRKKQRLQMGQYEPEHPPPDHDKGTTTTDRMWITKRHFPSLHRKPPSQRIHSERRTPSWPTVGLSIEQLGNDRQQCGGGQNRLKGE